MPFVIPGSKHANPPMSIGITRFKALSADLFHLSFSYRSHGADFREIRLLNDMDS